MTKFFVTSLILSVAFLSVLTGCKENKKQKLIEKVFVVNIVPDSSKLKEYLAYHQHVWPEVEAGFKRAGYKKIAIYRYNYLVVMIVTVPEGADLHKMGEIAEAYSPRCAEWNKMMSKYQVGVAGTSAGQTWVEAQPYYIFSN